MRVVRRIANDDENRSGFLAFHTLGVLGIEEGELVLFFLGGLERIDETDAGEWFVFSDLFEKGVLDVHRRDVVRQ